MTCFNMSDTEPPLVCQNPHLSSDPAAARHVVSTNQQTRHPQLPRLSKNKATAALYLLIPLSELVPEPPRLNNKNKDRVNCGGRTLFVQ